MSTKIHPAFSISTKVRLKSLLRDATMYGGAAAISKAFSLITFPLLARYFSVEEYGVLDYFMVLGSLLAISFIFGQDSAVGRFFYEYEDSDTRRQLISQSLVFQLGVLALLLPLLWLGADWLTELMISATNSVLLFKTVLLQLPFLLLINFSQNLLKWSFERKRFLILSLGYTVVQAGLLVVALLIFDVGVEGVLLSSLATSTIFGAIGVFFVRNWLTTPRDFSRLREMLPFAIPFGVICVAGAFSPTLERTLTSSLLGGESLGLYAAASKMAMIMGLFVSAFQTAWGPFSLSLYKQADAGHTYNWVYKLFALVVCVASLTLTVLAQPLILILASDRYLGAVVLVFPLAMGFAVQSTSWITEIGIGISKRSHLSLYAHMVAVLFTLGSIWVFTPIFGLFGIGLGVLIGHVTKAVIASWLAQKAYPLQWQYSTVVIVMILTILSGFASIWMCEYFGLLVSNLLLVGAIFLIISVGWLVLFSQAERIRIRELWMRRRAAI